MELKTLKDLFQEEIQDLYSAEIQLIEALPKMAENATHPKLIEGFHEHLTQTQEQALRLEEIAKDLEFEVKGKTCKGMEGVIKEGEELLKINGDADVKDAGIIGAAQRVEHYEMAGYGTAIAHAKILGYEKAAKLLHKTYREEEETDKKLSKLAEEKVNKEAADQ